jgi:hypothetical protein
MRTVILLILSNILFALRAQAAAPAGLFDWSA